MRTLTGKYRRLRNIRVVIEALSFLGVALLVVVFAVTARAAPGAEISGQIGGIIGKLGMRWVLFLLFIGGGLIAGALFLFSRYPRLHKYPVKINAGNVEIQYHILKLALCIAQLVTVAITCYLMLAVYHTSISLLSFKFGALIGGAVLCYIAIVVVYILVARRFK